MNQANYIENIVRFRERFKAGDLNVKQLKEELSRWKHANVYGSKYQKDYGRPRAENFAFFWGKNWLNETLKEITE
jgi:hypothetical protein